MEAKQTAKTIVEQANVQAQQVVEQANSRAQVIEQDTGRFFDSLIERIDGMQQDFMLLHQRMEESVNCLNNRFAQLDEDIAHAREIVLEAKERLGQQGKKVSPVEQGAEHSAGQETTAQPNTELTRLKEQLKDKNSGCAR